MNLVAPYYQNSIKLISLINSDLLFNRIELYTLSTVVNFPYSDIQISVIGCNNATNNQRIAITFCLLSFIYTSDKNQSNLPA